mgnify:CR=1 FL=1
MSLSATTKKDAICGFRKKERDECVPATKKKMKRRVGSRKKMKSTATKIKIKSRSSRSR